jgi:ketosteroid isomerase-like protein
MAEERSISEFQAIEDDFNDAVLSNEVDRVRKYVTDDWILVDGHGGIVPGERFFAAIEQGLLSHSTMSNRVLRVRVYGDIAVVTGRGQSTGMWRGEVLEADEWITDVYQRVNGGWLCVLTHSTPAQ